MRFIFIALALMALALPAAAQAPDLGAVIAQHRGQIEKPSRQSIGPVVQAIAATGPQPQDQQG